MGYLMAYFKKQNNTELNNSGKKNKQGSALHQFWRNLKN